MERENVLPTVNALMDFASAILVLWEKIARKVTYLSLVFTIMFLTVEFTCAIIDFSHV